MQYCLNIVHTSRCSCLVIPIGTCFFVFQPCSPAFSNVMGDIWKRAWRKQTAEYTTPPTSLTKRRLEDDAPASARESKRLRRTTNGVNGYPSYCTEEDLKILEAAKVNDCRSFLPDGGTD